jgi:hypothetical protein
VEDAPGAARDARTKKRTIPAARRIDYGGRYAIAKKAVFRIKNGFF